MSDEDCPDNPANQPPLIPVPRELLWRVIKQEKRMAAAISELRLAIKEQNSLAQEIRRLLINKP